MHNQIRQLYVMIGAGAPANGALSPWNFPYRAMSTRKTVLRGAKIGNLIKIRPVNCRFSKSDRSRIHQPTIQLGHTGQRIPDQTPRNTWNYGLAK